MRACVVRTYMRASVRPNFSVTCIYMDGFQNNLTQLFSLNSRSVIWNNISGSLKVKVTLEGQLMKWSLIELVRDITSPFVHDFQNNLTQLFSLKSESVI